MLRFPTLRQCLVFFGLVFATASYATFAPAPVAAFPRSFSQRPPVTHVGLQCDARRNIAFIRLGWTGSDEPPRYVDLPAAAPGTQAPVAAVARGHDGVCRLANGVEVKLRRYSQVFSVIGACGDELIVVWAAGRRIIGPTGIDQRRCRPITPGQEFAIQMRDGDILGWVIAADRIEVCLKVVAWTPGPQLQCRIIGDPARTGVRDAVEYPSERSALQRGRLRAHYARDARFCGSFIRRGTGDTADELSIPVRFARPPFFDGQSRFDIDNDGVVDDVFIAPDPHPDHAGRFSLRRGAMPDTVGGVVGAFFDAGRTLILTTASGRPYGPVEEAGAVSEILPPIERGGVRLRHICRFHRAGSEEPHVYGAYDTDNF